MTLFLTFASLFAAVIPITFFLFLIWRWDLYDRKPLWLMGGAFLWGALGSVPLAIVGQILLDPVFSELFGSEAWGLSVAIGAPITEEPAKALILVLLIRSRRFNNICDGFVFGAAAGLGFGMTENAKYFIESALAIGESYDATGQWVQLVVTRTLFCAVMHGTATSLVGAAAGISKFNRASIRSFSICIGMAWHWRWVCMRFGMVYWSQRFHQEKVFFVYLKYLVRGQIWSPFCIVLFSL
jgi:RsiW-degrading membrane proteinase PrsW (M82 family)